MDSWRRQEATEQAHRRDVNESIEDPNHGLGQEPGAATFRCECGDPGCTRTISLSMPEYETVRAYPNHFVIAVDHEDPGVERVITETKRFAVVETVGGEASKVALRTDPRALYSNGTLV